jgi:hypothetical protein
MTRLRAICTAVALVCASGQVFADTASHNASAEAFLTLAHADKLGTPVYMQVQQMFAQRFQQTKAPESKKAVLETYQAKANAALDQAIGWNKLKPDMVKLYTTNFSESELKDLVAFYQSPLGKKVLEKMPQLTQQSAQMTQAKLESAVPVVNKLLADMTRADAERRSGSSQEKALSGVRYDHATTHRIDAGPACSPSICRCWMKATCTAAGYRPTTRLWSSVRSSKA